MINKLNNKKTMKKTNIIKKIKISGSILSADLTQIKTSVKALEDAGVDMIHLDIMDGTFVTNITIGHQVVQDIRKITKLPLDVHLMVQNPERHIEKFAKYCDIITIHYESVMQTHINKIIHTIKDSGVKAGIALVPSTHELHLEYLYDIVDYILIMTVNPGFGGQKFISNQFNKIKNINDKLEFSGIREKVSLGVDGGITSENIKKLIICGADTFVIGSELFKDGINNIKKNVLNIQNNVMMCI